MVLIFVRCVHVYLYGMSVHGLHLDAVIQKKNSVFELLGYANGVFIYRVCIYEQV